MRGIAMGGLGRLGSLTVEVVWNGGSTVAFRGGCF